MEKVCPLRSTIRRGKCSKSIRRTHPFRTVAGVKHDVSAKLWVPESSRELLPPPSAPQVQHGREPEGRTAGTAGRQSELDTQRGRANRAPPPLPFQLFLLWAAWVQTASGSFSAGCWVNGDANRRMYGVPWAPLICSISFQRMLAQQRSGWQWRCRASASAREMLCTYTSRFNAPTDTGSLLARPPWHFFSLSIMYSALYCWRRRCYCLLVACRC